MATLPYDFKTNHMPAAPEGTAFALADEPAGNLSIDPVTGILSGGLVTEAGVFTPDVTATYNGVTKTFPFDMTVTVPGSVPTSAFLAMGDLSQASNRTLNGGDTSEWVNKVSGGNTATQSTAARQPTLTTVGGAQAAAIGGGECLEFTLPAAVVTADEFHMTARVLLQAASTENICGMIHANGGNGKGAGLTTQGSGSSFADGAGTVTGWINGASQGSSLTRSQWNDLVYPPASPGDVITTVTLQGITPSANGDWTAGPINLLGYPGAAGFSLNYFVLAEILYTDIGQREAAETWVETESAI